MGAGPASSEREALELARESLPSMAILDINLGLGGSGLNVGRELAGMGVAIMYATGNGQTFEQEMRDSGARAWLPKPYSSPSVPRTLEVVAQLHAGLPLVGVPPHGLVLLD